MSMLYLSLILHSISSSPLAAQERPPKNPMQVMLEKNQDLKTKEYLVTIKDIEYHKIIVEGDSFYFSTLSKKKETPRYLCDRPSGHTSEHLVEASLKVRNRKRFFFQALKEKCSTRDERGNTTNNKRTWIVVEPVIGIHLPESKNDRIKNKKLGIPLKNPQSFIFSGDF